MNKDLLKKHHFWILFGIVPLLVLLAVVLLNSGVGSAIAEQQKAIEDREKELEGSKPKGKGYIAGLEEQMNVLEVKRGELWDENYKLQKEAGIFNWPKSPNSYPYLRQLEALDFKFGAPMLRPGDDTPFKNDENGRFRDKTVYEAAYDDVAKSIAPTRFGSGLYPPGTGWQTVLRYVSNWGTRRPNADMIWLALEDFWVQRALLDVVQKVNTKLTKFEPIPLAPGETDEPLHRKFQSRIWEIDLEVQVIDGKRYLKSKVKNRTDRLQMLGINKTMKLNVWFDDPAKSSPMEYAVQGELVPGKNELNVALNPVMHLIRNNSELVKITQVEQVLDEITVPVKLVKRLELGVTDHRRKMTEMKGPLNFLVPDESEATEAPGAFGGTGADPYGGEGGFGAGPTPGGLTPGGGFGGREGDEGGGPGGPGGIGGAGTGSARTGTPEAVLLGNRLRYSEVTEQLRRMPVGIVLVVDQDFMTDVMVEYTNSLLRFQITQTQFRRFRSKLAITSQENNLVGGAGPGFPGGFGGQFPGAGGGREGEGDPDLFGGAGSGTSGGPGYPGYPGSPFSGGSLSTLPSSQVNAGLIELGIYGVISLYEKHVIESDEANPTDPVPAEQPMPMPGESAIPEQPMPGNPIPPGNPVIPPGGPNS